MGVVCGGGTGGVGCERLKRVLLGRVMSRRLAHHVARAAPEMLTREGGGVSSLGGQRRDEEARRSAHLGTRLCFGLGAHLHECLRLMWCQPECTTNHPALARPAAPPTSWRGAILSTCTT